MYVIKKRIKRNKYFNWIADKRFALINKCHNILVKRAKHLLNKLDHDKEYQKYLSIYRNSNSGSDESKEAADQMNTIRENIGLTKTGLCSYIKVWQKRNKKNISSMQAQKEAERVMQGVEKVLFGDGKELHFRKLSDTMTICGKNATNGVVFDRENDEFRWINETFQLCKIKENDAYMINALYPNGTEPLQISYCEIKRMMFPNGWHYYLYIYVKGDAPKMHATGTGKAGIDPGTSTMAMCADKKAALRELAPKTNEYVVRMKKLLRTMDRSRRDSNPENYNENRTVIKGRKKWKKTRRYMELERKYQSLCRQKALYVRQSHCILANELLQYANHVIVEHMNYKGLQKKAKRTERQEKESTVTDKNGNKKKIHKYKRRKRFGKSIASRAPAEFLTILKMKIASMGGYYEEVDTKSFRASQYDHSTDTYRKSTLDERFKVINGIKVQRDLYSAFLLKNSNNELNAPDRNACIIDFEDFVKLQNQEIQQLKASGQSMPSCFGF